MGEVGKPALQRLLEVREFDPALLVGVLKFSQAAAGAVQVGVADANAIGENAKAEKVGSVAGFKQLALDWVNLEAELGQVGFEGGAGVGEEGAIVGEEGEVIDVAEVALGVELFFTEVVEAVEVDVGKELAGEVADWQAARAFEGG